MWFQGGPFRPLNVRNACKARCNTAAASSIAERSAPPCSCSSCWRAAIAAAPGKQCPGHRCPTPRSLRRRPPSPRQQRSQRKPSLQQLSRSPPLRIRPPRGLPRSLRKKRRQQRLPQSGRLRLQTTSRALRILRSGSPPIFTPRGPLAIQLCYVRWLGSRNRRPGMLQPVSSWRNYSSYR